MERIPHISPEAILKYLEENTGPILLRCFDMKESGTDIIYGSSVKFDFKWHSFWWFINRNLTEYRILYFLPPADEFRRVEDPEQVEIFHTYAVSTIKQRLREDPAFSSELTSLQKQYFQTDIKPLGCEFNFFD